MMNRKKLISFSVLCCIFMAILSFGVSATFSDAETTTDDPGISINIDGLNTPANTADTVKIVVILTVIALVPSILVLMTGFTRISIVLSFVRNALGLQQTPPNQVLIGLSLFLTVFLMMPIFQEINEQAYQPYIADQITQDEALDRTMIPLKTFMLEQTYPDNLELFLEIADAPSVNFDSPEELLSIGAEIIIPAFILSELKRAFIIGFCIYVPFLIIDLVVSSTLMSLGMMMLPPAMVSMPFKLILFLIVDGWNLVVQVIFISFNPERF